VQQAAGGDRIACGQRFVRESLGTVNQRFMIVRGKKAATVGAILKVAEQRIRQLDCELEVPASPSRLQHLDQAAEHEGVVVEISGEA
jgi:hypothetical protein